MTITLDGTTGITSPNDTTGNQSYTGTLTGGTGVVNLGSGQFYKDASGNIGIGTATPAQKLDIASGGKIYLRRADNGTGATIWNGGAGSGGLISNELNGEGFAWQLSGTEKMRIASNGYVGIGTSNPQELLHVNTGASGGQVLRMTTNGTDTGYVYQNTGAVILGAYSTRYLGFETNGAERMRIDSSGNLCVGGTVSNGAKLNLVQAADSFGQIIRCTNANYATHPLDLAVDRNTTNNSYYFIRAAVTGVAYRFQVADSGNVTNTNNSYGAISDIKNKENIVDATPKLNKLLQVKVRSYNLKGDYEQHKQIGVVAQELEEIFPSLVEETTDRDADGKDAGTTTKSVKYSVFVPMLIKAIQEQQAMIETLTTRLTVLEAK